jgi:hypothetical protein
MKTNIHKVIFDGFNFFVREFWSELFHKIDYRMDDLMLPMQQQQQQQFLQQQQLQQQAAFLMQQQQQQMMTQNLINANYQSKHVISY